MGIKLKFLKDMIFCTFIIILLVYCGPFGVASEGGHGQAPIKQSMNSKRCNDITYTVLPLKWCNYVTYITYDAIIIHVFILNRNQH